MEGVLNETEGAIGEEGRIREEEMVASNQHGSIQMTEHQKMNDSTHFEREEASQEWDIHGMQEEANLNLELLLPLDDVHVGLRSPTIYSTASDTSLQMTTTGPTGGWKMTVTEESLGMEDLDIEDMLVDQQLLAAVVSEGANSSQRPDGGVEGSHRDAKGEKSAYKKVALTELQIETYNNDEPIDLPRVTKDDRRTKKQASSVAVLPPQAEANDGGQPSVHHGSEINRVVSEVELAMATMPQTEGGRKMKQVVASNSEELRKLVNRMYEDDKVGAVMINDEGALLLISSESSGDVGGRKRKRKNPPPKKMGSVASRLRKKDSAEMIGKEVQTAARETGGKRTKMAVRKIKVSAKKPSTSLTLAPPTLGFPTP